MKTLTDIIYQYENAEFSYPDTFDCCVFTAKIVEEFTGRELPIWRDFATYTTYKQALLTLKKLGCKDVKDVPEIILGKSKKDISEVKLGEPVYYINEEGRGILGVCNGERSYFLQRGGGLTARNTSDCLYCWSID